MIENYVTYLKFISEKLEKFFENQKDYIFCKKGCAKCCKNAQFPYSMAEVTYLLQGSVQLDDETQNKIYENVIKINKEKEKFDGKVFLYDCPFLINDACCVYEYRGLVCRSFGLITKKDENTSKIPFCYKLGLNYSNVMDFEQNKITPEKFAASGIKEEPHGYNVSYDFLTSEDFERAFNFKFGEKKPLIDWLKNIKE